MEPKSFVTLQDRIESRSVETV